MAFIFQKIAQGRSKNPLSDLNFMRSKSGLKPISRDTRQWFRDKAASMLKANPREVLKNGGQKFTRFNQTSIGKMYMFFYDAKNKETLPYFDRFPVIFLIDINKNGFMGLNLHYLPPIMRAKLMDALYETLNNKKFDDTTKLRLTYQLLKRTARMRFFKPCVKQYLFNYVRSNLVEVNPTDWDYVSMLPLERFSGASKEAVFRDSIASVYQP